MFGFLLKKVLPDQNLQEKYIQESNLEYTIIRPSALTAGLSAITVSSVAIYSIITENLF
ncbi:NAD(P)H-binding protein [Sphingobacterium mizutaii]|uniref:NAD(P)H-binding protein n=1 Tax=Sphingobacterium mizutaii TaxID=1010 RepID=UPI003D990E48